MADSFQVLKKAEDEAFAIVDAARKERARKMKMAKVEAEKEIEKYRAKQMEEVEVLRQKVAAETRDDSISKQTAQKLDKIKEDTEKNKQKVIDLLIEAVLSVETSIPVARKGISTN
eukprot:maker-scaffold_11-snap-gene-9.45-mRNA-1 protein AED:0.00 eAED:0.00 QI:85/1/1/1/1/1/3/535/115